MTEPAESYDWDEVPVELYVVPPEEPGEPEPAFDGIEEAIRSVRNRNAADGHLAMCILHELRTARAEALPVRELVAGEMAAALSVGIREAARRIDLTEVLADKLVNTLRAVCAGDVSWDKAAVLADEVVALSHEKAREVEEATLPDAARRTAARHADAVRRAVARIDPEGFAARRKQARSDIKLIRFHYGDGMGQLFARMPSEQLDTLWLAADMWARGRKSAGDPRALDHLRVASLGQWAQSYLHHGDPTYCDRWCSPGSHEPAGARDEDRKGAAGDPGDIDRPPATRPPTRHGRPGALHVLWDLTSLLGLTRHCGELTDSGAMLPPDAVADLVAGGLTIRRMLIDEAGELVDLTPRTWRLLRTKPTDPGAPVVLGVVVEAAMWQAINDGTADPDLLAALATAPPAVQKMLGYPVTADELDETPNAYPAPARLAEFVAMRDRHPTNPTAGTSAASAADIEHPEPFGKGGRTVRRNATAVVRRWHRLKTLGGWTVRRHGRGWLWTSPKGREYVTGPYDYRLGP